MTWYQPITLLEILFGGLFLVLYLLYLLRIWRIARQLGQRPHVVWVKFGLRSLYLALLLISILGPSFGAMKKQIKTTGKDIFIAVDLSESMNARDVQPSRLEKVKFELSRLIQKFNSDRIGLIIFSSEAFLQSPLTFDQQALQLYIEILQTKLVPKGSTNLAAPLELAIEKFHEQNKPALRQKANVLVLISDGEDFGEDLQPVVRKLKRENIRLFTLGVGTEAGGKIPSGNGFKRDESGQPAISRLNTANLASLAEDAGGQYYEINDRASEVSRLISAINNIEGEVRQTQTIDVTANKYFYPLLLALLLIVADLMLTFNVFRI